MCYYVAQSRKSPQEPCERKRGEVRGNTETPVRYRYRISERKTNDARECEPWKLGNGHGKVARAPQGRPEHMVASFGAGASEFTFRARDI